VEANHAAGIDHDLGSKGLWQDVIRFFELDKSQADTTYGKDPGGTGGTGGMSTGGTGGMSTGGAAGASAGGAGGMIGSGGMVSMTGGSAGSVAMTGGASGTSGTTGGTVGTTGGAGGATGGTVGTTGGAGGTTGGMATSGAPDTGGDTTETEPSGCGCRLGSQSSTERSALAALGLGLLGIVLRRRRSAPCVSQSGNRQAPPSYV
jgi:MYXO-CTERM domain-containing protein